ncbi:MAG: glutamine--tRNA ligase/YqeY domain fusion protein [Gammaproteobacteria bacterium]|nr:glutamine--tRNA ligase/YqeY domain fusion protein [Gammaproteobacteria bacterium]
MNDPREQEAPSHFIREIIRADIRADKNGGKVYTRFPPEPNGYLHVGHAKAICLNFGIAEEFGGRCNLRFDDTNPEREDQEYVEAIKRDVRWLGYDWAELRHASDYFEQLYEYAVKLIETGKAYVDDFSAEQIRNHRGTLITPGQESPARRRSHKENLDLFARMRAGEFKDGEKVLRAKIDMASPNMNMRDPVLYRIKHATHQNTGDAWCIYPMYDFTQCLSDAIEGVTHSLCTLEFEDHRPLYDWVLDEVATPCHPQQIEFARLNLSYTITSKRKLNQLVQEGHTTSWDDPRMPTISGMRRRGYPPAALRDFCNRIGITKNDSLIDFEVLENSVREELNQSSERRLAVLDPLRVVIENYPDGQTERFPALNHPFRDEFGSRQIPFSKVIYIERDDFMEEPAKKFFRLAPGREVRLRFAYYITCSEIIRDAQGEIVELRCSYDPQSRGGTSADGRKVKGTIHWVSAEHSAAAEIRLYDRLFLSANPAAEKNFLDHLNPESLRVLSDCKLEPSLLDAESGARFQFERQGYFAADSGDSKPGAPVFNRIVTLRDTWAKVRQK